MRRAVWVVPVLAAAVTLVAAVWPGPPGQSDSPLAGVFGGPELVEARMKEISIPFGFETVDLRHNNRQVDTTGPIQCTAGERFRAVAFIVQETDEGTARGEGQDNGHCTGELQTWEVRVVARGPVEFEAGEAQGIWILTTYDRGKQTDRRSNEDSPATLRLGPPPVDVD